MASEDTKERLLDAAERLFAEHGFAGASSRALIEAAGVANQAAVHYHFGSKEQAFTAVIERRIRILTQDRLARLDALESTGDQSLESITRALVGPLMEAARTGDDHWLKLLARSRIERGPHWDSAGPAAREMFDRFVDAYAKLAPDAARETIAHGVYLLSGSMLNAILDTQSLRGVGHGLEKLDEDRNALHERALQFLLEGFRASLGATIDSNA